MKSKSFYLATVVTFSFFTGCSKKEESPVIPDPAPSFVCIDPLLAGYPVRFVNTSRNAVSFIWDFGDGSTDTTESPTHAYSVPGIYTVRLTAKGANSSATSPTTLTIVKPHSASIVAARLLNMPFLDPSCNCGWDPSSGPDVFFKLTDNANNVLANGITYTDASAASLPLKWNYSGSVVAAFPYEITDFNKIYKFAVYDADAPPADPDDLIGEYSFNLANAPVGYTTTIILNAPPSTLTVEISLHWE